MYAPICDGRIALNVEGKRYIASFRFERGVITVTSGSASQQVDVGDVDDPKSVARTVLKTMVAEGRAALAFAQTSAIVQEESTERVVDRARFFVRPSSTRRHSRTHH